MTAQEARASDSMGAGENTRKIRGWLLFPAYVYPVCKIAATMHALPTLFTMMARPGLSLGVQAYMYVTLAGALVLSIAWIACGYFAYTLKPFFPKAYIWTSLADIAASAVLAGVAYAAFGSRPFAPLITMIVIAAIWIPYMLMSKRVKATFPRERPAH